MTEMSIEEALRQAVSFHQAGRLADAEKLYRAIIQVRPGHPEANYNLGALAVQVGRPETRGRPRLSEDSTCHKSKRHAILGFLWRRFA